MKIALLGRYLISIASITLVFSIGQTPIVANEQIITQRISLMRKDILGNFKIIMKYVKNEPIPVADVAQAGRAIQSAAKKLPSLFPKGTARPYYEI